MLGSSAIATVRRSLSGRVLIVQLEDPGDNPEVAKRLNAVLRYLRILGIEHDVSYRIVSVLSSDCLDYLVYVRVGDRKFRGGRLTMVVDLETKRAEVFVDEDKEVIFFYGDPEYEELGRQIREALRTWEANRDELSELVVKLWDARVPPEHESRLRELLRRYNRLTSRYWWAELGLLRRGDWVYGVKAKYIDKVRRLPEWVAELMELRRELEEIATGGRK